MRLFQSIIIALFSFLMPVQGILIAVAAAIALDTCTGVYKSVKTGQPLISRRFADVILKMMVYELVTLMIYAIDHFLLSEFFLLWFSVTYFFTKSCAMVLIFTELVSIKENVEQAHGINFVKQMRNTLRRTKDLKDDIFDLTQNNNGPANP